MRDTNDVYVDDIFEKLNRFIKRIFRLFFRFLSLIWSKKIILLGLLVIGLILGYILDATRTTRYETVLQVRTLQSSTEYVYNLINNLNKNLGDSLYLKQNELSINEVQAVEILPMANMEDLISSFSGDNSQTLETLILNTSTQDLLTSEFFRSQYSQHEIFLKFGSSYSEQTISKFLSFLNNNSYYQDLYKLRQASFKQQIKEDQTTINKIDTLITNYNSSIGAGGGGSSVNALINEQRATSIFDLLKFRTDLIREVENLKGNLEELEAPVTLTNKPVILEQEGLVKTKLFFVPFVLVVGFIVTLLVIAILRKLRSWAQKD